MSFLKNLPKEFIRSAVRQVGRDGGRVISNKVYKGKHGTPIYNSSNRINSLAEQDLTNISNIDMSIQPKTKSGSIWVLFKGLLIQFIPFGIILVLMQGNLKQRGKYYLLSIPLFFCNVSYSLPCSGKIKFTGANHGFKKIAGEVLSLLFIQFCAVRQRFCK